MTVDRLTQIRRDWEEKGNGPRGRDVDFLLGVVEQSELEVRTERTLREIAERERDKAQDRLVALPATESAQPEQEGAKPCRVCGSRDMSRPCRETADGFHVHGESAQPEEER